MTANAGTIPKLEKICWTLGREFTLHELHTKNKTFRLERLPGESESDRLRLKSSLFEQASEGIMFMA